MGGKRAAAGAVGSEGGTGAQHGEAKAQTAKKKAKVSEAPPPAPLSRVALEGYWRLTMKEPENGDTCQSKRTTGYLRLGGSDKYVEGWYVRIVAGVCSVERPHSASRACAIAVANLNAYLDQHVREWLPRSDGRRKAVDAGVVGQ